MAERGDSRLRVIMPPEFDYLGGLFLPDLGRARLASRLASAVARWRRRGYPVQLDLGSAGYTAGQSASLLASEGVARALVIGGDHDRTGAVNLRCALVQSGINCPDPLLSSVDGSDIIPQLRSAVEKLPRPADSLPGPDPAVQHPFPVLLIADAGERPPDLGVPFEAVGRGFRRRSPGRAGSVPPWVSRIEVIQPGAVASEPEPGGLAGDEGTVIYGLTLPAGEQDVESFHKDWLRCSMDFIKRAGPHRCRLVCAEPDPLLEAGTHGTAWAARYGIHRPPLRGALLELVRGCLPQWFGLLHTVIGLYEIGTDPLEEMYAGNSLPDRNAQLIENIVP